MAWHARDLAATLHVPMCTAFDQQHEERVRHPESWSWSWSVASVALHRRGDVGMKPGGVVTCLGHACQLELHRGPRFLLKKWEGNAPKANGVAFGFSLAS